MSEQWTYQRVEADLIRLPETLENFRRLLPDGTDPEKFALMIMDQIKANPRLLDAIRQDNGASLLQAANTAAEVGLSLNRALQHSALIPRKRNGRFFIAWEPMYRGLAFLMVKYGAANAVWAGSIFKGDKYQIIRGSEPKLIHEPAYETDRDEDLEFAYACARLPSGEVRFEIVTREKLLRCRDCSESWKSEDGKAYSPWTRWFREQCEKTAVKQLAKLVQTADERLAKAIAVDNEDNNFGPPVHEIRTSGLRRDKQALPPPAPEPKPLPPPEKHWTDPKPEKAEEPKKTEEELKKFMQVAIWEMCGKDRDTYRQMLSDFFSFKGKDGNFVPGPTSLEDPKASGRWLLTAYGKVKKAYEEFLGPKPSTEEKKVETATEPEASAVVAEGGSPLDEGAPAF